jgi:hypothetical protein
VPLAHQVDVSLNAIGSFVASGVRPAVADDDRAADFKEDFHPLTGELPGLFNGHLGQVDGASQVTRIGEGEQDEGEGVVRENRVTLWTT